MAQVPPPPQADGRKIFWADKVDNNVDPPEAITASSSFPFMMIFTSPVCTSFDCAKSRINTNRIITIEKATIDENITGPIVNYVFFRSKMCKYIYINSKELV